MQLKSLTIRRRESYESNGGTLGAEAHFEGPGGAMTVELAPGFIVRVLALIEEDAAQRAKRLAASCETALVDAVDSARLIESDAKPLEIPF
ncbi:MULTISPECIES: hypothetical protein [Burkholderia cepacia complex]|uniref:hypothetical protein n=1 Tax=Burkholderia cepacia complex TaxID=87882 RepID=UPI0024B692D9|nr:hypothetical protein [Burkholderia cenocepacia]MDI9680444.1 hypothetical protein [Burkholderia cenocepacia]